MRQATSRTVGSRAAERSARDGRRCLASARRAASCAPAPSRSWPPARRAGAGRRSSAGSWSSAGAASWLPVEREPDRAARAAGRPQHDDAEQGDAEAERGEHEVLPAGLERARLAGEARPAAPRRRWSPRPGARPRRGCRPAGRRGARPRTRERGVVRARGGARGEQRVAAVREVARGRRARSRSPTTADHADENAAGGVDAQPVAEQRPVGARSAPGAASSASGRRRRRRQPRERRSARRLGSAQARQRRRAPAAPTASASSARLVTQAPQLGGVAASELARRCAREGGGDEDDQDQVGSDAELDHDGQAAGPPRAPRARAPFSTGRCR